MDADNCDENNETGDIIGTCQDIVAEWNAREETKVFSEIPKAIGPRPYHAMMLVLGPGCSRGALGWEVGIMSGSPCFDMNNM